MSAECGGLVTITFIRSQMSSNSYSWATLFIYIICLIRVGL